MHSIIRPARLLSGGLGLLWAVGLTACQAQREQARSAIPPVAHYEGSLGTPGQADLRAALDIRHPSPGHYEAEFTAPTAGTLNFVADTLLFSNNELRLTRPARPGEVLTLKLEGDFWRGSLNLDTTRFNAILVKRGEPAASTYRVEEIPQATGSAWLFAPSDTSTPGAALMMLPDTVTAAAAALWADGLARDGVIVLLLPAIGSTSAAAEMPRLQAAVRLLRNTPGADTAKVGAWAAGARAPALVQAGTGPGAPRLAFFIAQNADPDPAFRELARRKMPVLGLYGGASAPQRAAAWRAVLGAGRGSAVRAYRAAGPDLLVSGRAYPQFGAGLPGDVTAWLRSR
ncbi:hypothetical protein IC235_17900 [Hymenobacter sp. BT664]|uniref:Uncharacterized protein n=1 Tax=Hymenobacter montanus TaxID=2771359 RepID=A0A927GKP2_9BACT|nr:hypothetical protein [Hymenobacter montanus]MBD2769767.1 hypothetical protein [Hymenobacter montanus]